MGLRLKVSVCSKWTTSKNKWSFLERSNGRARCNETYNLGHRAHFQPVIPWRHLWCCARLHSRKVTDVIVWENGRRELKRDVQTLPTFSPLDNRKSSCVKWACFWDRRFWKVTEIVGYKPISSDIGKVSGEKNKAYRHLYESDVHFWHLIICLVLRYFLWHFQLIAYYMLLIYNMCSHFTWHRGLVLFSTPDLIRLSLCI